MRWLSIGAAALIGLVILAGLAIRLVVLTPQGRGFVVSRLEGLPVGPVGRLHLEGLEGDLWSDFSLRRLAIIDQRGVWLDAHDVRVRWDWPALLGRRVLVEALGARNVEIARAPVLTTARGGPSGPPPVSITVEALAFRLETQPAVSVRRGLFSVVGRLDVEWRGGIAGEVHSQSLLRPGDGLDGRFDLAGRHPLRIDAHVREASGGPIAGLAGLPADLPFSLDAHAFGAASHGFIHLTAVSGGRMIAQIDGVWSPRGGSGGGRISLAASRWTSGWMRQLGPELRLVGRGQGLGASRYDLALQASADNASALVSGAVDNRKGLSFKELNLQLKVLNLSRFVSTPAMGPAALDGVLSGGQGQWRFFGGVAVQRLNFAGYDLARAGGSADLSYAKGAWRLKTNLTGAGGQGRGLLAALAGAAPHVIFDGQKLADGRFLLSGLNATGAGLKLQASGQRSLLGALSFKGQAELSNLAAAYPGAHGLIDARWTASQRKFDGGWSLTADAAGVGFASGQAVVDRLLGTKPTLALAGSDDNGAILVSKASLVGAAAKLDTHGQIGKAGELTLALDWIASGPFALGPVTLAGQTKGGGALSGTLSQPRLDLLADIDRVEAPDLTVKPAHVVLSLIRSQAGLDGLVSLAGASDYGPAHAKAALHVSGDEIALTDLDAAGGGASAAGAVTLRGGAPEGADLALDVGPGAFATQGHAQARFKLANQPGGAVADVAFTADNLVARGASFTINQARLTASGPLARLPYVISASAAAGGPPVKLDGSGVFSQAGHGYQATFSGAGAADQVDFRTETPAVLTAQGDDRNARLDLVVGGGEVQIDADAVGSTFTTKAALTGVDLAVLDRDLAGKMSAQLAMDGEGASLTGTLEAQLQGARSRDAESNTALDGTIHAALDGAKIVLDARVTGATTGEKASVSLSLPADASAAPFHLALERDRPISGQFDANGELAPIWNLFFGGEQSLGGALTAHGGIGGTLAAPTLTGRASLAQGSFEDAGTGLKLRNLTADIDLSERGVNVERFAGQDAKSGAVSGSGQLSLAPNGASTLTLDVKGFQLLDNDDAKASATGTVTVTRDAAGKVKLAGALTIDQADISAATRTPPGVVSMDVVEINRPAGQPSGLANQPQARAPDIGLDIQLNAPRHVFVRGLGLNAELDLHATVGGTLSNPVLGGQAQVVRGDYDFAGKRFEIDDQGTISLATSPDQIRLNLSATWEQPSLTAVINIKGTAARPVITLSSIPVLPQDEVLSQVLFGASAAQLSPVEAAQLAAAVTTLATGGGFDVMGGLSRFARLDRIALGGDQASGVTISGGKYIGNHLYLELTGGGRYGGSGQLEYRANRSFSLVSQIGGLGGAMISFRWRHDFGQASGIGKPPKKP